MERWLLSLNQGVAGRPDHNASEDLSHRIVPGWEGKDAGWLDRIEVGRIAPDGGVPFRIVDIDGHQTEGLAEVSDVGDAPHITSVHLTGSRLAPSSSLREGRRSSGSRRPSGSQPSESPSP